VPPRPNLSVSVLERPHSAAALVCAFGFFLRIILSAPLLNVLGIDYGSEDVSLFGKIHPGNYFIFASFLILIFSEMNPLEHCIRIARQQTASFAFFTIYVLVIIGWIMHGPKGVGLILDVHIVAPIMAIVFSYAPKSFCRTIVYLFGAIAVLNSVVGLLEAAMHVRIFTFNSDWEVLKQDYFRASAFLGHPLANAVFTVVSLFVILSLRIPLALKSVIFLIMLSSLAAFGSRSALGLGIIGLVFLGMMKVKRHIADNSPTVLQLLLGAGAILVVPVACAALLYVLLHSSVGERLLAYSSLNDESADVRLVVFRVFDHMSFSDIVFGIDGDRILDIAKQAGLQNPNSDIESPWILMFMFLGAIMFALWFCGWAVFVWRLMTGAPLAVKIAVIEYFAIATTSNSFGRKDLVYATVAGIVVCVKRMQEPDNRVNDDATHATCDQRFEGI
jgi:hypothetical protein